MIEIQSITKVFDGPKGPATVLKGISLSIGRGEIFGIIGRSGAGKSTLVRCINALERPTSGRVVVNGVTVSELTGADLRAARRDIGMIFQHFNLLSSRTVFDNVALPLELAGKPKAEIEQTVLPLLDLVGLSGKRDQYPSQLSGGQKQRVGIARALSLKPNVLLCDEATSALDPETTTSILALLKDINAKLGLTIVLITHEMNVIKEICDRVAVLDHGNLVELGSVFDVFSDPKAEVSQSFVRDVLNHDLPSEVMRRLRPTAPGNPVIRITFTGPSANTPVIAELIRDVGVGVNILHGHIDYIQGQPYGTLAAELDGPADAIEQALAHIRAKLLKVEVLGHVADDDRAAA
ncbi:methionine ABC transporter ATP-binding protein [Telmatospirillum sp. J64-1]|uniref:methionine ABC transporter ATP-binding protein n=1 Tax=Telmatospirillum sp. J64-1 TaxID=2502183 RepID=UPI00115F367A|nr:methionine ABC transporter ATP-binding protein [Telmatospirillum sp. J64-1]